MRVMLFLVTILCMYSSWAIDIPQNVQNQYIAMGGPRKALDHLKCFLANHNGSVFDIKKLQGADWIERCNNLADNGVEISMENPEYVVIMDYTAPSSQKRFYLLNLSGSDVPVQKFYLAHGRYNTDRGNTTPGINKNTIEWAKYFSNVPDTNASATGFYITGREYRGALNGPKGDKNSLILHGVSLERNDNACARAIILHGSSSVNEKGPKKGVTAMSSGCPMLDYNVINEVISLIRGGGGDFHPNEDVVGGTVVFSYGVNEANEPSNFYCTEDSLKHLRSKP